MSCAPILSLAPAPGVRRAAALRSLHGAGRTTCRAAVACAAARGAACGVRGQRRRATSAGACVRGRSLVAHRAAVRSSQPELPLATAAAVTLKRRQPAGAADTKAAVVRPAAAPKPASGRELLPAGQVMPVALRAGRRGAAGPRRLLCYGDSLTAGFCANGRVFEPYGQALGEALASAAGAECEVLVCGHSGHLAAEMVANMDGERVRDVASRLGKGLRRILREEQSPELVLIMAGTNDLGKGKKPEDIFQDLRRLHAECHARGLRTLALAPPAAPFAQPPAAWEAAAWEASRRRVKDLLAAWAQTHPLVAAFVDPSELVPPSAAGAWDADRLHFSPAGSRLLGRRLAPLVLPLLPARPLAAPAA